MKNKIIFNKIITHMTPPQYLTLFFTLFLLKIADAQPDRTLTGIQILKQTVEASGGDMWQNPETLQLIGVATFTPFGRTDSAHYFDNYAMWRVYPKENNAAHQANGKVRFDAFEGKKAYFELKFDGKKSAMNLSDAAKPYAKHFSWSNNFGFSIIRYADRDSFKVERLTDDKVDGKDCFMVQITDPKKMVTLFGIDKKTFYIRYLGFTTELGYHHRIYSDFVKVKGKSFIQPERLRIYFEGVKWVDIHWQKYKVNETIEDVVFTAN
jgi:hypothetical protein